MAFTLEERQALGIHGLLPPRFKTQEEQVRLCKDNVARYTEDLNKHIYLVGLQVYFMQLTLTLILIIAC
jgi:malate dehydrogenase (oxaloacetate-decarboxylating)(NADP+)